MFQYLFLIMVMERPLVAAMKTPGIASASVDCGPAAPFDTSILPSWSFASKFVSCSLLFFQKYLQSSLFSSLFGSPFAIAVGSGATAHSSGGGAVAVSDGKGAKATAVSHGGYAEAAAIGEKYSVFEENQLILGADTECSASSNEGEIEIKRNERQEDGTVKNDEFKHHY